jgi:hypothetical protein
LNESGHSLPLPVILAVVALVVSATVSPLP